MIVKGGSTDVITYFQMRLTAGGDATGLTITDFDLSYTRSGATTAAKVDATDLGSANASHSDNGGFEVDPTDCPGLHRFDWPDAAFAAGVREVILTIKHASCFTESLRVEIDPFGAPAGASLAADIAAIKSDSAAILVDTAEIGAAGAGLTAITSKTDNLPSDPADQSLIIAATDALATLIGDVPTNAELATALGSADDAVLAQVALVKAQTDKLTFDGDDLLQVDAQKIDGSVTAAENQSAGARGLVPGTCSSGSSTTSIVTNLTEATDDHYNGRVITFISGALAGQSTNITDYNGTSKTLTVTALTEAPSDTDAFVIA